MVSVVFNQKKYTMKSVRHLVVLTLLVSTAWVSCQKEEARVLKVEYEVLGKTREKTTGTGELFYIRCATLQDGLITLQVVHGGKDAHAFAVTCDGTITVPDPDSCSTCTRLTVMVNHLGINENKESLDFIQEVTIPLADLKLPAGTLERTTVLVFKNSSDESNLVGIWSPSTGSGQGGECTGNPDGGDDGETDPDMIYDLPVVVAKSGCDAGAWGQLWLKADVAGDDPDKPPFTWLMPVEVYTSDSLPAYSPREGDKLTGTFRKMSSGQVCETISRETQPVYIYGVTKR